MSEHGTFSSIVAEVVRRSNRPDRVQDVISYARTTIRECTVKAFFRQDFVELSVTVLTLPFVWTTPVQFRQLDFVQYPAWDRDGRPIFGREMAPKNVKSENSYWYYRAGNDYVFSDCAVGTEMKIGYYSYSAKFAYFATDASKPAVFTLETGEWTYHADYSATPELQEQARGLVSSWLLFNWHDTIVEGCLAKMYKTTADQRAAATYGLYKSLQNDILAGEAVATVGG